MSQAEALLANVTAEDVAMFSSQYVEVEPHIVIGIDRFITVPDVLKRIAVQRDHNMRTVTFDCPRYYDGRDMASMKVYVNYINLNDKTVKGSYVAENVVVDDLDVSVMHFDWTIKSPVTPSPGKLAFLVCVRKVDTEGIESNHWNSELNTECYISEGMEFDPETIQNEYPDIITQLLERMDVVETLATPEAMQGYTNAWLDGNHDKVLDELQAKGEEVLATIPADYTETSNLAVEASANGRTKADAITRTVEGSAITVDDSSDDYIRGLRIFGNTTQVTTTGTQMIPQPYFDTDKTINGVKWTVRNDGALVVAGKASSNSPFYLTSGEHRFAEGTYTISGSTGKVILQVDASNISTGSWVKTIATSRNGDGVTFTISAEDVASYQFTVYAMVEEGNSANVAIYPMLNSGSTAAPYEVYTENIPAPNPNWPQDLVDVTNPNITIHNKNLLNIADKSAKTDGAYYIEFITTFEPILGATYTLSANIESTVFPCTCSIGCGDTMYRNEMRNTQVKITAGGRFAITFTWELTKAQIDSRYTKLVFRMPRYDRSTAFEAIISDIQLELGAVATAYEPYKEQQVSVSHVLRGIPINSGGNYTDDSGRQWLCDEIDFERGVLIQRVYRETVGFSAETDTNGIRYRAFLTHHTDPAYDGLVLCDKLSYSMHANPGTNGIRISTYSTNLTIAYYNGEVIDSATILYPLATPIETPLSAEELAWYKSACTNYHNTTVFNSANAEMEFKYNADTEIWIKNLIKVTSPLKSTTVALSSSKWVDTTYGYSQVVTMNGITPNSKVDLQPSPDQLADLTMNNIAMTTSNDNGVVTVHAIGSRPGSDMVMQVQITEVIQV